MVGDILWYILCNSYQLAWFLLFVLYHCPCETYGISWGSIPRRLYNINSHIWVLIFICLWNSQACTSQIAKFMGPTWVPPGPCQSQMGPILAPWTLLSSKTAKQVRKQTLTLLEGHFTTQENEMSHNSFAELAWFVEQPQNPCSIKRRYITGIWIPIINRRRYDDCFIYIMGILTSITRHRLSE